MIEVLFQCLVEVNGHGVLKNGKQIFRKKFSGKPFITASNKAKTAKAFLNSKLLIEKLKQRVDQIDCDINAEFTFFYPKTVFYTKQGKRSNRVADLSNLYELVQDCLQEVGILLNDSQICSHNGSSRKPIEDTKYYLKIVLTKTKE